MPARARGVLVATSVSHAIAAGVEMRQQGGNAGRPRARVRALGARYSVGSSAGGCVSTGSTAPGLVSSRFLRARSSAVSKVGFLQIL